ncbi:amidohydrolase [Xylariaceae sp. FL0804]|nr:amidohydrolase [Xylariaceae sp. FL0804]
MAADIPIIDAHIHLWPGSEVSSLNWCKPDHPLAKQQSVEQYYRAATTTKTTTSTTTASSTTASSPSRFIFVETDRTHDLAAGERGDSSGWAGPLAEVAWMRRVVEGAGRPGEGLLLDEGAAAPPQCAACVPWAPMPSGAEVVDRYLAAAQREAGEATWARVRGVRYLVQDAPAGTMLADGFVEALRLLGRRGLAFDLGVDQHRRGRAQLEEAVEMIDRAHEGVPEDEKVVVIINHMCKPDLTVYNTQTDTSFLAWRTAMFTLSRCRRTYMKLSGGLSEMPEALRRRPAADVFDALVPWLTVLVAAFGPARLMFASDWPVCTLGVDNSESEGKGEGDSEGAWPKWQRIVERLCWMASFDDDDRRMIWGGTALKAYGIE